MKKWTFWFTMCIVSLLNGALFLGASAAAMRRGIDGVDNQASLLFIPVLWIIAAFVLVALNAYTLFSGRKMRKGQLISLFSIFRLSALSKKEKAGKIAFLAAACLLMLFGYFLFETEAIWAAAYALSGGMLLLFLYAWKKALP